MRLANKAHFDFVRLAGQQPLISNVFLLVTIKQNVIYANNIIINKWRTRGPMFIYVFLQTNPYKRRTLRTKNRKRKAGIEHLNLRRQNQWYLQLDRKGVFWGKAKSARTRNHRKSSKFDSDLMVEANEHAVGQADEQTDVYFHMYLLK